MHNSRRMGAGLALVFALILPGTVDAIPMRSDHVVIKSRADLSMHKLGRGLANIGTAVFEIPRMTSRTADDYGWWAASTIGLAKGVWYGALRLVTGVFEVVTFPLEIPKDYGPLLEPEFVFEDGDYAS